MYSVRTIIFCVFFSASFCLQFENHLRHDSKFFLLRTWFPTFGTSAYCRLLWVLIHIDVYSTFIPLSFSDYWLLVSELPLCHFRSDCLIKYLLPIRQASQIIKSTRHEKKNYLKKNITSSWTNEFVCVIFSFSDSSEEEREKKNFEVLFRIW